MRPNFPLLHQVYNAIVENPARWTQGTWRSPTGNECGTSMCFAGWVAELTNAEWYSNSAGSPTFQMVEVGQDLPIHVSKYAEQALGLTSEQAEELFGGYNTLDDIREYIDHLHVLYDPSDEYENQLSAELVDGEIELWKDTLDLLADR